MQKKYRKSRKNNKIVSRLIKNLHKFNFKFEEKIFFFYNIPIY